MTKFNFSAGPAVLPKEVLLQVQSELLDYRGTGSSVMEISHRSKEFEEINDKAERDLRSLLSIPDNYKILFMQGGGTTQFSAAVYNLCTDFQNQPCDFIVTGAWSSKAYDEAVRVGAKANLVCTTKSSGHKGQLTDPSTWNWSQKPAFIYYCDNETVHGVELPSDFVNQIIASSPSGKSVPIVCDMSSNILSRPIDVSKFGVIFAGAQKNVGPAGVTIVIVRDDLLHLSSTRSSPKTPLMLEFKTYADSKSMYNTPPCFPLYVSGLVFDYLLQKGGLKYTEAMATEKSELVYNVFAEFPQTYSCPVDIRFRSRMNIPFRILNEKGEPDPELEKSFLKGAESRGLLQLKGHRSVGGIRASLYNALPMEAVHELISYMRDFACSNN